ncbi:MAG TPA: hypothetical protein PLS69_14885, partial [Terricaulis sp.]|nr:hypothetical protein [Terricaulis sp.]
MKRKKIHHRPGQRPQTAPPTPAERELAIAAIGARGDGVTADESRLFAPFTLPGERVRARLTGDRAELLEVLTPSAERQEAPCRH